MIVAWTVERFVKLAKAVEEKPEKVKTLSQGERRKACPPKERRDNVSKAEGKKEAGKKVVAKKTVRPVKKTTAKKTTAKKVSKPVKKKKK